MDSDETKEKTAQLINDLQDISFYQVALIVFGAWFAIYLVRKLLPYLASRGPSQIRLYLLGAEPILRLFFMVGAIVWLIPIIFNITRDNFLVIAGSASVAIGFAFKDLVSSIIAGVVAVFERPYRPGDWVKIGADYGEVQAVGLRAIRLQTPSDDIVTVPHARLWTDNVINSNDGSQTLMCVANFYLHPDHPAETIRAALYGVALTSAYLTYDRPIVVVLSETTLGTHYKLKAYPFDMRDQFGFISDLTVRGKKVIAALGGREVTAMVAGEEKPDRQTGLTRAIT